VLVLRVLFAEFKLKMAEEATEESREMLRPEALPALSQNNS
jgi:hypothetical protein